MDSAPSGDRSSPCSPRQHSMSAPDGVAGASRRPDQSPRWSRPWARRRPRWESAGQGGDLSHFDRVASRPVKTRCRTGRSPRSTSCRQRSRFRSCGWPVIRSLRRSRLRSIVGRHSSKLSRFRSVESRRCSCHERRSERVSLGTTGRRTTLSRKPCRAWEQLTVGRALCGIDSTSTSSLAWAAPSVVADVRMAAARSAAMSIRATCQSRGLSNCKKRRALPSATSSQVHTTRRSSKLRAAQPPPEGAMLSASSSPDCVGCPVKIHSRQQPPEPQLTRSWVAATPRGRSGASDAGGTAVSSIVSQTTGAARTRATSPSSTAATEATTLQRTRAPYGDR